MEIKNKYHPPFGIGIQYIENQFSYGLFRTSIRHKSNWQNIDIMYRVEKVANRYVIKRGQSSGFNIYPVELRKKLETNKSKLKYWSPIWYEQKIKTQEPFKTKGEAMIKCLKLLREELDLEGYLMLQEVYKDKVKVQPKNLKEFEKALENTQYSEDILGLVGSVWDTEIMSDYIKKQCRLSRIIL